MALKVNLKVLSQSLGLSQTTVSRALGGYSDVSPVTRQRVLEAARASGYQPDTTARRLATGRAEAVGIIYPFGDSGLGDPRFVEVMGGLSDGLAEAGMELMIAAARPATELDSYRRLTSARSVDALIVANTRLADERIRFLQQRKFPFVAYGRTDSAMPYAWFDFDNEAGARLATERLLGFGHRRIALIHAPVSMTFAAQRHAGYLAAMRAAGLEPDPALVVEVPLDRHGAYEATRRLLALPEGPTALLVDNNLSGVGTLRALMESGWQPGRGGPSLIVYDGVPADLPLPYRVTSVEQPTGVESGRAIAQLVLNLLAGEPVDKLHQLAQPVIAPGDTDGPVAHRG
ncbi:LacI family DNA-binding transcriptional regulator [Azohydromonas sp. G-1-1-14]|uniref:LacI family DNA-binding transcriptional regulator n=1 Tax=Azohydromonas caseinilytica TaxID=2728836 RepID=A0A848FGS9_9BURK|nr:LacI family DNA-binding transcriptional regulator [Azohydromonas caseinilytica]